MNEKLLHAWNSRHRLCKKAVSEAWPEDTSHSLFPAVKTVTS